MMAAQKYYIVPRDIYEHVYNQLSKLSEKIDLLPSTSRDKARLLVTYLNDLVTFDQYGRTTEYKQNIYDYVNFAVRGKEQPIDWYEFTPVLAEAPKEIFAEKARGDIIFKPSAARRHGR